MAIGIPRRKRRRAGIATMIGGAIAAVLLNWMGYGPARKATPTPTPSTTEAAGKQNHPQTTADKLKTK